MTMQPIDKARLDANWQAITWALDAPPKGRLERALLTLRLPEPIVRTMVSTPTLRRAWLIAMGVALLFGLAAGTTDAGVANPMLFLVIAPLVPTLGVAMAYGEGADPAHEITVTTPLDGFRLVLMRATAVFAVATPVVALLGLAMEGQRWVAGAWLLPALALSALALLGTTVTSSRNAAMVVTGAWAAVMMIVNRQVEALVDAFGTGMQVTALVVLALAAAAVVQRRHHFDEMGLHT